MEQTSPFHHRIRREKKIEPAKRAMTIAPFAVRSAAGTPAATAPAVIPTPAPVPTPAATARPQWIREATAALIAFFAASVIILVILYAWKHLLAP